MMTALVKICGITNVSDAALASAFGADFVGLIFCSSPRQIAIEVARQIRSELQATTKLVGVFKDQAVEEVNRIARECKLDLVQLHGGEEPDYIAQVEAPVIKVFTFEVDVDGLLLIRNGLKVISSSLNNLGELQSFAPFAGANYFLFDKPKGVEFDDALVPLRLLAKRLLAERSLPSIFIAGALNEGIVQKALELVQPFAVDVASAVEQSPGSKSKELMDRFIETVKSPATMVPDDSKVNIYARTNRSVKTTTQKRSQIEE